MHEKRKKRENGELQAKCELVITRQKPGLYILRDMERKWYTANLKQRGRVETREYETYSRNERTQISYDSYQDTG